MTMDVLFSPLLAISSTSQETQEKGIFNTVLDFNHRPVTWNRIYQLHCHMAPNQDTFNLVWTHCQIVALIALQRAQSYTQQPVNYQKVVVGGLVHDIGVYRLFKENSLQFDMSRYLFHGLEGWLILQEEHFGEEIANFARNHTGLGITHYDVYKEHLPLPLGDYSPQTVEQELVMYADKFHTKSNPPEFISVTAARRSALKFGSENAKKFDYYQQKFGNPQLDNLACGYSMNIRR